MRRVDDDGRERASERGTRSRTRWDEDDDRRSTIDGTRDGSGETETETETETDDDARATRDANSDGGHGGGEHREDVARAGGTGQGA